VNVWIYDHPSAHCASPEKFSKYIFCTNNYDIRGGFELLEQLISKNFNHGRREGEKNVTVSSDPILMRGPAITKAKEKSGP
jgi:hypothetical protein